VGVKNLKRIFLAAAILIIGTFLIISFLPEPPFSEPQEETIDMFGYPQQFVVTYMPSGDAEEPYLIRTEVWYYPDFEMQITFSGGEVFNVEDYMSEDAEQGEGISPTNLKPEDFIFDMGYAEVSELLGAENIDPIDMPGFFEQGVIETYLSDQALFIIEHGKLSYIQTVGLESGAIDFESEKVEGVLDIDEDVLEEEESDEPGEYVSKEGDQEGDEQSETSDFTQEDFEEWLILEYGEDVNPDELDEEEVVKEFLKYLEEKESE